MWENTYLPDDMLGFILKFMNETLECCSFDAYNEAGNLKEMAERFRELEGHYPSRILADKIYRNRENLSYCKGHGIRLSGPALGRPKIGLFIIVLLLLSVRGLFEEPDVSVENR